MGQAEMERKYVGVSGKRIRYFTPPRHSINKFGKNVIWVTLYFVSMSSLYFRQICALGLSPLNKMRRLNMTKFTSESYFFQLLKSDFKTINKLLSPANLF